MKVGSLVVRVECPADDHDVGLTTEPVIGALAKAHFSLLVLTTYFQ